MSNRSTEDTERDLKARDAAGTARPSRMTTPTSRRCGASAPRPCASTRISISPSRRCSPPTSARPRAPRSPMSLANLKGRQQNPDAMIPYLKDTIRHANNLQTSAMGHGTAGRNGTVGRAERDKRRRREHASSAREIREELAAREEIRQAVKKKYAGRVRADSRCCIAGPGVVWRRTEGAR